MESESILQSSAEQGVSAWIQYLNQVRLDVLVGSLSVIGEKTAASLEQQSGYFKKAVQEIDWAIGKVDRLIESNRGGKPGVHGYIAEVAQTGVGNARSYVVGGSKQYDWLDNNGQWDLIKHVADGKEIPVQVKFTQGSLSLKDLLRHVDKYPDSIKVGGEYMIPKDHFELFEKYAIMSPKEAGLLRNNDYSDWKTVQSFLKEGKIPKDKIVSSDLTYKEVQKGTIHQTLKNEMQNLKAENDLQEEEIVKEGEKERKNAYEQSKPSFREGAKATLVSAAIEGGVSFVTATIEVKRSGKKIKDFSDEDWEMIFSKTGMGTVKGAVRGAGVYVLSNFTATPSAVANSLVTASFGVAGLAKKYRAGELTEDELIDQSETVCMDAAVSAVSSIVGQTLIPIPVIGAIVGNAVGTILYQVSRHCLEDMEKRLVNRYVEEMEELDNRLSEEYRECVRVLNEDYSIFLRLVFASFSVDVHKAYDASIQLAEHLGLSRDEILDTAEKRDSFFLD